MDADRYATLRKLRRVEGEQQFHIDAFGDHLAQKRGYKERCGIEAVRFYLVEKYHWTPATVRALNTEGLAFLLAEEMSGWTLPANAKQES